MRRRHILFLSDGRPGHYRQSEGVLAALARLGQLETTRIETASRRPRLARLLRPMAAGRLARLALALDHPGLAPPFPAPDVVVSAGGATMVANIALARLTGAPNIFCGSLRNAPERAFTVWLTGWRGIDRPRHLECLKPTPVDPDAMRPPGPWRAPAPALALIVGGPTGAQGFGASDWERLAALADAASWPRPIRIEIVTSPRTPPDVADRLAAVAAHSRGAILDFRSAGPGSILDALDRADAVIVTDDSMSMVNEAVAASRPVLALGPAAGRSSVGETRILDDLAARRLIARAAVDADPAALDAALDAIQPLRENHLDTLAAALARRLDWPEDIAERNGKN